MESQENFSGEQEMLMSTENFCLGGERIWIAVIAVERDLVRVLVREEAREREVASSLVVI